MKDLIRLPRRFFDDHAERDLPSPTIVEANQRHVWVRADDPNLAELQADAHHYTHHDGPCADRSYLGLKASARATLRALLLA